MKSKILASYSTAAWLLKGNLIESVAFLCPSLPPCLCITTLPAIGNCLKKVPHLLLLFCLCLFLCLLSCCRTQAEMAHTCRGTINLATAHIDTEDACNIVLSSGGRTYHLKASTEVERQRWVTALELAKAKAIRMMNDQSGRSSWRAFLIYLTLSKYNLHGMRFTVYSVAQPRGTDARHLCSEFDLDG